MKIKSLLLILTVFVVNSYSQNLLENKNNPIDGSTCELSLFNRNNIAEKDNLLLENLSYDCSTVFWTVNGSGNIQQWDLIDGQVSGGAIVQTNSGVSLSFCGETGLPTFYSTNYPSTGILKFDNSLGWINIPTSMPLLNNGGYLQNQYFYYSDGNLRQDLYHFDGITLNLVEHLTGSNQFRIADIAVDSLGRAWVFTGNNISPIDTLSIYDSDGLVTAYPFAFNGINCYGSFFIDDVFYVGIGNDTAANNQNSIIPINIIDQLVTTGTPIPFPNNGYLDMASCNNQTNLSVQTYHAANILTIYPNPSNDFVNINLPENILTVMIYSIENKLIKTYNNTKIIDISFLEKNIYILKIVSHNNIYHKLVIKQ